MYKEQKCGRFMQNIMGGKCIKMKEKYIQMNENWLFWLS